MFTLETITAFCIGFFVMFCIHLIVTNSTKIKAAADCSEAYFHGRLSTLEANIETVKERIEHAFTKAENVGKTELDQLRTYPGKIIKSAEADGRNVGIMVSDAVKAADMAAEGVASGISKVAQSLVQEVEKKV